MSIPPTHERPKTRAACVGGPRPCPWVGCRHHLYLEVNQKTGKIKVSFPDLEPWQLEHSCALDEAEEGPLTLEEAGARLNMSKARVDQIETVVLGALSLEHDAESFGFVDRREQDRAQWQSAYLLSGLLGVKKPEYVRRRVGAQVNGYVIEQRGAEYRAVKPITHERRD